MKKDRLSFLLNLRDKNLINPLQSKELEDWVDLMDFKQVNLEEWIAEKGGEEKFKNYLLSNFKNLLQPIKISKDFLWKRISIAASIAILISIGFFYFKKKSNTKTAILAEVKINKEIMPGSSKAILILSNGSQVALGNSKATNSIEQSSKKIAVSIPGKLDYHNQNASIEANSNNTIIVPNGGEYQIVLSDGTKVWLNAATKLTYPVKFTGHERRVKLSGEAYFEVTHNKSAPFLVETLNQTVKVLGTHFNINAYNDEKFTKTTLIEGKVEVNSASSFKKTILLPGEQSTLAGNTLMKNKVDTREVLAWKNRLFRISDQDLYSIMSQISRWYDVDVEYKGDFSDLHFGLYISRKRNIEQILDLMEVTKTVKFKIEGRKVIVMK
jgi:transmembrane sensor